MDAAGRRTTAMWYFVWLYIRYGMIAAGKWTTDALAEAVQDGLYYRKVWQRATTGKVLLYIRGTRTVHGDVLYIRIRSNACHTRQQYLV